MGELAWRSGRVMNCHATDRGSIPGWNGVFTELLVLRKGQLMRVASRNDLAVDGTLNTNNHWTSYFPYGHEGTVTNHRGHNGTINNSADTMEPWT